MGTGDLSTGWSKAHDVSETEPCEAWTCKDLNRVARGENFSAMVSTDHEVPRGMTLDEVVEVVCDLMTLASDSKLTSDVCECGECDPASTDACELAEVETA